MASLRSAIKKALKFCGDDGVFASCRFISSASGNGGHIVATDGQTGTVVEVSKGFEIPDCVVSKQSLVAAVKSRKLEFQTKDDLLYLGDGTPEYLCSVHPSSAFPLTPERPTDNSFQATTEWQELRKILHARGTNDNNPELHGIVFSRDGYAEATDSYRVARVWVGDMGLDGSVPGKVFLAWPTKKPFSVAVHDGAAWFKLMDEYRWGAVFFDENYPDTTQAIAQGSSSVAAPLAHLIENIEQTSQKLATDCITLYVSHLCDPGDPETAWAGSPNESHPDAYATQVSAKQILETLRECDTPCVRLAMTGDQMSPVVIDSGRLSAAVWPVLN